MTENSGIDSGKKLKLTIIGLILAAIGMGISVYTISHHHDVKALGSTDAACNISSSFNCDDIARSEFAEDFHGNPVGLYGFSYFLGIMLLLLVARFKEEYSAECLSAYRVMVIIGVLTSLVLFGISQFKIGTLCPSCMGVYAVTLLQGGLLFACYSCIPAFDFKKTMNGGYYPILTLAGVLFTYQFVKPVGRNIRLDLPKSDQSNTSSDVSGLDTTVIEIPISRSAYSGLGEDYRKGPDNAKVKIIEFADFQCPACRSASGTLDQLKAEFGNKIQIIFKNYPLDSECNPAIGRKLHPFACRAAVFARCAGRFGHFWKMHDKIFSNQSKLDEKNLNDWAKEIGLTQEQIKECSTSKDLVAKIKDDIAQGDKAGVTGTPALYINNRKVLGGRSYPDLRKEVQLILDK